jgi:hypothetical protein
MDKTKKQLIEENEHNNYIIPIYIYGLYSSNDELETIRYVGLTYSMKKRMVGHKGDFRNEKKENHKNNWARKVMSSGSTVCMKLIEECNSINCDDREVFWISEYRKTNNLTNVANGGKSSYELVNNYVENKYTKYWTYDEMKAINKKNKILSWREYAEFKFKTQDDKIPSIPNETYKDNGWISGDDFLNKIDLLHLLRVQEASRVISKNELTGWENKVDFKWNFESCQQEASKFKSPREWIDNSGSSYAIAMRNGWLSEIYEQLGIIPLTGSVVQYTYEVCQQEANKYNSRGDWVNNSRGSYNASRHNGWIEELTTHMKTPLKSQRDIWDIKENCATEALKFSTRKEFQTNSRLAYESSNRNKWMDEICIHMISNIWTIEEIQLIANKYTTRHDFYTNDKNAYDAASKRKILNKVCVHMEPILQHPANYWTKELCHELAKKFTSRINFQKNESGAYQAAQKNNWLDEICAHMKLKSKTNQQLAEAATLYNTRIDFKNGDPSSYDVAQRRKIMDEICSHMTLLRKSWTTEELIVEAKKYNTRVAFKNGNSSAYESSCRKGIMDEICKHMESGRIKKNRTPNKIAA